MHAEPTHTIILETERIRMRPVQVTDFSLIRKMDSDPECMKYIVPTETKSEDETLFVIKSMHNHQLKHGFSFWVWERIPDGAFIGWGGLKYIDMELCDRIEVGYTIVRDHWNQGYTKEACRGIVDYAWNSLGLQKLYARVDLENTASVRIVEGLGMEFENKEMYKGIEVYTYGMEAPQRNNDK